jgi:molybdate transport system substrate-binding protein
VKRLVSAFILLVTLCIVLAACGSTTSTSTTTSSSPSPVTLNVFAAASLTGSFQAIGAAYHKAHPNVSVKFNFAGSQILEQQIANGAPADVFASADLANMTKASDAGLVDTSQVFAKNKLVVILPLNNLANITSLNDLTKKGIKIDLEAKTVPAGAYTLQILANMSKSPTYGSSFGSKVLANVVSYEDNVKAVVQKVELGEADAGFVYQTDFIADAGKLKTLTIPDDFNVIAQYPIAVVKASAHASDAQAFIQFVLDANGGQDILEQYKFISVNA